MDYLNKNILLCVIWFAILALIILALWILLSRPAPAPVPQAAAVPPSTDMIATQALTNGNLLITNATAHYELIVPATWYLEKENGGGIALYPDYDPMKKAQPSCKVDISVLENQQNDDLDDWLTDYLHADPTTDMVESSRIPSSVSSHAAITWAGTLNGVSTTLAYISREDGSIYEVAPSLIEGSPASSDAAATSKCSDAFQAVMSGFRISP